jgi:alpha-glucosidase (family GH31 glycosyl hydrolase)
MGPRVVKAAKEALTQRYSLLPFLYTLFVKSHIYGHPVVTPTFYHAMPGDKIAYTIDDQFFWGNDLLVVPVLTEVINFNCPNMFGSLGAPLGRLTGR